MRSSFPLQDLRPITATETFCFAHTFDPHSISELVRYAIRNKIVEA